MCLYIERTEVQQAACCGGEGSDENERHTSFMMTPENYSLQSSLTLRSSCLKYGPHFSRSYLTGQTGMTTFFSWSPTLLQFLERGTMPGFYVIVTLPRRTAVQAL